MAPTDAQRRAREKWLREKIEPISIRAPKGRKDAYKQHAEKCGESLNAFLLRAAEETIIRDIEKQEPEE